MYMSLLLILVAAHYKVVASVICYWCSGVDSDRMCETRPRDVSSYPAFINCTTKYCVSSKVMDSVTGLVRSFARSCDHISRGNICVRDTHLLTCFETCTSDLCNDGNPDPSYLPTNAYSAAFLGLPDGVSASAFKNQDQSGKLHEHNLTKSGRKKYNPAIKKSSSFVSKLALPRKYIPERETGQWWHPGSVNRKPTVKLGRLPSLNLSSSHNKYEIYQMNISNGEEHNDIPLSAYIITTGSSTSRNVTRDNGKIRSERVSNVSLSREPIDRRLRWRNRNSNNASSNDKTERLIQKNARINNYDKDFGGKVLISHEENAYDKVTVGLQQLYKGDNSDKSHLCFFYSNSLSSTCNDSRVRLQARSKFTPNVTLENKQKRTSGYGLDTNNISYSMDMWWNKFTPQHSNDMTNSTQHRVLNVSQSDNRLRIYKPERANKERQFKNRLTYQQKNNWKFKNPKGDIIAVSDSDTFIDNTIHPPSHSDSSDNNFYNNSNEGDSISSNRFRNYMTQRFQFSQDGLFTQNDYERSRDTGNTNITRSSLRPTTDFKLKPPRELGMPDYSKPFQVNLSETDKHNMNYSIKLHERNSANISKQTGTGYRRSWSDINPNINSILEDAKYTSGTNTFDKQTKKYSGYSFKKLTRSEKDLDVSQHIKTVKPNNESDSRKNNSLLTEFLPNSFPGQAAKSEGISEEETLSETSLDRAVKHSWIKDNIRNENISLSSPILDSSVTESIQKGYNRKAADVSYGSHSPADYHLSHSITRHQDTALVHASSNSTTTSRANSNVLRNEVLPSENLQEYDFPGTHSLQIDEYDTFSTQSFQLGSYDTTTAQSVQLGEHNTTSTKTIQPVGYDTKRDQILLPSENYTTITQSSIMHQIKSHLPEADYKSVNTDTKISHPLQFGEFIQKSETINETLTQTETREYQIRLSRSRDSRYHKSRFSESDSHVSERDKTGNPMKQAQIELFMHRNREHLDKEITEDTERQNRFQTDKLHKTYTDTDIQHRSYTDKLDKSYTDTDKLYKSYTDTDKLDKSYTDTDKLDKSYTDKLDKSYTDKLDKSYTDKLDKSYTDGDKLDKSYTDKLDKSYTDRDKLDKSYTDRDKLDKSYTDRDKLDKSYTDRDKLDKSYTDKLHTSDTETDKQDKSYTDTDKLDKSYTDTDKLHRSYTDTDKLHRSYTDKLDKSYTDTDKLVKSYIDTDKLDKSYTDTDKLDKSYTDTDKLVKSYTDTDKLDKSYIDRDKLDKSYTNTDKLDKSYTDTDKLDKSYTDTDKLDKSYTDNVHKSYTDKLHTSDTDRLDKSNTDKLDKSYTDTDKLDKSYTDTVKLDKSYTDKLDKSYTDKLDKSYTDKLDKSYTDKEHKSYKDRLHTSDTDRIDKSNTDKIDKSYTDTDKLHKSDTDKLYKSHADTDKLDKSNTDTNKLAKSYTDIDTDKLYKSDIDTDKLDNSYTVTDKVHKSYIDTDKLHRSDTDKHVIFGKENVNKLRSDEDKPNKSKIDLEKPTKYNTGTDNLNRLHKEKVDKNHTDKLHKLDTDKNETYNTENMKDTQKADISSIMSGNPKTDIPSSMTDNQKTDISSSMMDNHKTDISSTMTDNQKTGKFSSMMNKHKTDISSSMTDTQKADSLSTDAIITNTTRENADNPQRAVTEGSRRPNESKSTSVIPHDVKINALTGLKKEHNIMITTKTNDNNFELPTDIPRLEPISSETESKWTMSTLTVYDMFPKTWSTPSTDRDFTSNKTNQIKTRLTDFTGGGQETNFNQVNQETMKKRKFSDERSTTSNNIHVIDAIHGENKSGIHQFRQSSNLVTKGTVDNITTNSATNTGVPNNSGTVAIDLHLNNSDITPNRVLKKSDITPDVAMKNDDITTDVAMKNGDITPDVAMKNGDITTDIAMKNGDITTDVAMKNGDITPDVAMKNGDITTDIAMKSGDITPDVAMKNGDITPDVAMKNGDITPDVAMKNGNITPDIAMNNGDITPDVAMKDGDITPDVAMKNSDITPDVAMKNGDITHDVAMKDGNITPDIAMKNGDITHDVAMKNSDITPDVAMKNGDITHDVAMKDGNITTDIAMKNGDITHDVAMKNSDITPDVAMKNGDITPDIVMKNGDITPDIAMKNGDITPDIAMRNSDITPNRVLKNSDTTSNRALNNDDIKPNRVLNNGDTTSNRALNNGDITPNRASNNDDITSNRALNNGDITSNRALNNGDITSNRALNNGDVTRNRALKNSDITSNKPMKNSDITSNKPLKNSDITPDVAMKNSDIKSNKPLKNSDITPDVAMKNSDIKSNKPLKNSDITPDVAMKNSDIKSNKPLKNSDIKSNISVKDNDSTSNKILRGNSSSSSDNTTNKMASGTYSSRRSRIPSQRIYLAPKLHKSGTNQKFQSDIRTFTSKTNLALNQLPCVYCVLMLVFTYFIFV